MDQVAEAISHTRAPRPPTRTIPQIYESRIPESTNFPIPPCTIFEPKKKHCPWYLVHANG